jgi:hypothetical protein
MYLERVSEKWLWSIEAPPCPPFLYAHQGYMLGGSEFRLQAKR